VDYRKAPQPAGAVYLADIRRGRGFASLRDKMKQIPYLSLPRVEQDALLGALRQAGVAPRSVCVSRHELPAGTPGGAMAWFTVSGAGWCLSYRSGPGWVFELARDLRAR
jgi:hypothetical protein